MDRPEFTLIVPFYRNCAMLARQVEEWNKYPDGVKVICIDDGSPEPALDIIRQNCQRGIEGDFLKLYRIEIDIPWNREGARNLGAFFAETDYIVHVDVDHILPEEAAAALLRFLSRLTPNTQDPKPSWYRFPRWRVGKADETRKKDRIPADADYGEVHPHVDSFLIRRGLYWKTGGYDEDYAGSIGGGNPFLRRLEQMAGPPLLLPAPIRLEVYTRDAVQDANDWSLPRDSIRNKNLWRQKERTGDTTPKNPLRFPWTRLL